VTKYYYKKKKIIGLKLETKTLNIISLD
jgi:hypothetical protein